MSKELFMAEHERLTNEYLERHPDADFSEAYDRCADLAWDSMRDRHADHADYLRKKSREDALLESAAKEGAK